MNRRTYSLIWCVAYYAVLCVVGICQPFIDAVDSGASYLTQFVVALPATYWLVNDVKIRGKHLPHVIQPLLISTWIFVIPIYLAWTRRWWGLLYVILHLAGTAFVALVGYFVAVYVLWPLVFATTGG